jgi:hypothetical protein
VERGAGLVTRIPDTAGFGRRSNRRAVEAGLKLRSVVESARDTLAWIASPDLELWVAGTDPFGSVAMMTGTEENKKKAIHGAGLARDKEARVLAAWKAAADAPRRSGVGSLFLRIASVVSSSWRVAR